MKERLHVVDALRGFAIVSIMLLHNLEHFDFYFTPENLPVWMPAIDQAIWKTMFFLFAGKSFAIFALLFGLTFFIQFDNQAQKNLDFRPRFAWRMILLFGFGMINSMFYQGDILTLYAAVGLFLIPLAKLGNRWLLFIAGVLLLQPLELVNLFFALNHPETPVHNPVSWSYFGKMGEYITGNSALKTWYGNLTNGKIAVLHWSYENGRYFQILALFIFGYIAGRKRLFAWSETTKLFWRKALLIAAISFVVTFLINLKLVGSIESAAIRKSVAQIWEPYANLSFMVVLVAGFTLLFHSRFFHRILNILSPVGKMSLSNYLFQSVIGSTIYYGYGLGMYKYTGATYSFLIALALSTLFIVACTWWGKHFKYGPLEKIWHTLTWIDFRKSKVLAWKNNAG